MLLWLPYCCQVNEKVDEYSKYLFEPVDTNWSMVYEDGDMKVSITRAVHTSLQLLTRSMVIMQCLVCVVKVIPRMIFSTSCNPQNLFQSFLSFH